MDSNEEFNIPMPEQWVKTPWWKDDEWSPDWVEWIKKKSTWNWKQYQKRWNAKVCPFLGDTGRPCIKGGCVHFVEGGEYEHTYSNIYWYHEYMYKKHKCRLWGNNR